MTTPKPVFAGVVGQERAVAQLAAAAAAPVHAYLLVAPPGSGARQAATGFAAALLCADDDRGCGSCGPCRRALAGTHPDVVVVEREGASISAPQVDEIIRLAVRTPTEGDRKVLVLVDFHLVALQYPRLLKTLEEPPASTVFVLLADHLPPELVTIASRCVRIDLGPVPAAAISAVLEAEGLAAGDRAAEVAEASNGNLDRARLLAGDQGFAARQALWRSVPARLDGTGATVAALVDSLLAAIDTVLEPLRDGQAAELADLEARPGGGGSRKDIDDRHKREQRRVRQDELRSGLATLAAAYRDRLASPGPEGRAAIEAITAVQAAGEALIRNPNETLLLQGLLVRLTDAAAAA